MLCLSVQAAPPENMMMMVMSVGINRQIQVLWESDNHVDSSPCATSTGRLTQD